VHTVEYQCALFILDTLLNQQPMQDVNGSQSPALPRSNVDSVDTASSVGKRQPLVDGDADAGNSAQKVDS